MVQKHSAVERHAGAIRKDLFAERELPVHLQIFVAGGCKVGARFGRRALQFGQQVRGGFENEAGERPGCHVQARCRQDRGAEVRQARDVQREASDSHGLFVGFPRRVGFGNAFEGAPGARDFRVVIEEEDFGDGHRTPD